MSDRPAVTAIILCGGRASRLGGVEKPLLELYGKPLLGHVIDRLKHQVEAFLLSCARAATGYEVFGMTVVEDCDDAQGPLGGFASALPHVQTPLVLTTPADTPFLPSNLVDSLAPACGLHGAAVARAGGHRQNLAMLLRTDRCLSLAAYYEQGGRAVHKWLSQHAVPEVDFPADAFLNVNTPDDFAAARARV